MNIKISIGTIQATNNFIAEEKQKVQKNSGEYRKVSVIEGQDTTLTIPIYTVQNRIDIASKLHNVVYNIAKVAEYRNKAPEEYIFEEQEESNSNSSPRNTIDNDGITLGYLIEYKLALSLEEYRTLPFFILMRKMKEANITEQFQSILDTYTPHSFNKSQLHAFLSYILQCNSSEQELWFTLYIGDIITILEYIPIEAFEMLGSYKIQTREHIPIQSFYQSQKTIRAKSIRQSTIPIQYNPKTIHYTANNVRIKSYFGKEIINSRNHLSKELYYSSASYLARIITKLCSTHKTSIEHKRYLLILDSLILYYFAKEYPNFDVLGLTQSIYMEDTATFDYIKKIKPTEENISFGVTLETLCSISIQKYLEDTYKNASQVKRIIEYNIFWIMLFYNTTHKYSYTAMRITLSFLSHFSTIKFFIFERLYILACYIEEYNNHADTTTLFSNAEVQKAFEGISIDDFTSIVKSIKGIKNKKSFSLLLQKRFIEKYIE